MTHKITLIPGDGIGPEVTKATVRILEATGLKFEWETFQAGAEAYEKYHEYIPKELLDSIDRNRVALKGPVSMSHCGRSSSFMLTSGRSEICRTSQPAIPMLT